jgi:hypothetical protein
MGPHFSQQRAGNHSLKIPQLSFLLSSVFNEANWGAEALSKSLALLLLRPEPVGRTYQEECT